MNIVKTYNKINNSKVDNILEFTKEPTQNILKVIKELKWNCNERMILVGFLEARKEENQLKLF